MRFDLGHVERVIRHLVRFGASRADAEDLAQEVLVIAWRKRGELDHARSLDAWLYGIARNVHRNHSRTLRRRREEAVDPPPLAIGDGAEIAEALALREALQMLPTTQQDIVILHDLEEYTLKETAALLAIPFDTAKDRLRRARGAIRARIDVDYAHAARSERFATGELARAVAPAILVGVVLATERTATAGTLAAGAPAWTTKALLAVALAVGVRAERQHASRSSTRSAEIVTDARARVASDAGAHGAALATDIELVAGLPRGIELAAGSARAFELAAGAALGHAVELVAGASSAARAAHSANLATNAPRPVPGARAAGETRPAVAAVQVGAPATAAAAPTRADSRHEVRLVERARVALTRGDADGALRTLMAHERQFPAGQLAEERDVLVVEAYLATSNLRLAAARLDHYRATYPAGVHVRRADAAAHEIELRSTR